MAPYSTSGARKTFLHFVQINNVVPRIISIIIVCHIHKEIISYHETFGIRPLGQRLKDCSERLSMSDIEKTKSDVEISMSDVEILMSDIESCLFLISLHILFSIV